MADWPSLEELKQVLDVDSDDWDGGDDESRLEGIRLSAISRVKGDVGDWDDEADTPDAPLSRAALRMAELMALRPEAAAEAIGDPTYWRHLYGHRHRFGIG
jgi:hypothetical protein